MTANGLRFHCVEAGEGDLVLLLHGFPEFWYSYRHQLEPLSRRFRAVAPDLRGYNLSEKKGPYDVRTLTDDVAALIQALGHEQAHLVGNDWGGGVAWVAAARYPEKVRKLAILNSPHPAAFRRELGRNWRQMLRSWYFLFFQVPWLPEALALANDAWLLRRAMQRSARVKFSPQDLDAFARAAQQPGALTAAINWYRSLRPGDYRWANVQASTLLIWGVHDDFLVPELARDLGAWVPHLRVEYLDCGHWVQQEQPEAVTRLLLDFLA